MRRLVTLVILLLSLVSLGCTTTQEGTTAGALGGGAVGGIIGHQSGNDLEGAAIGAAVGGLGGYIVGEHLKKKFCPICGEKYDESVKYCPKDGTELEYIKE